MGNKPKNAKGPGCKSLGGEAGSDPIWPINPAIHIGIGWDASTARPELRDLLPPAVAHKMLDLWLATGANVLLDAALRIISDVEEAATGHQDCFLETLEADIIDRLQAVASKWEGGSEE